MKIDRNIWMIFPVAFLLFSACHYDVAEPEWDKSYTEPARPSITRIEPPVIAAAGFNTITIEGTNFSATPSKNSVYFDNVPVEVLSSSPTLIKVRRPNVISDSVVISVVSGDALVVAKFSPYRVAPVWGKYGNFVENLALSAMAVDKLENIYVIQQSPRSVVKVSPSGEKTVLGEADRVVTDALIGPGGILVLLMNNNSINQMNTTTGEQSLWVNAGKKVSTGDFDRYGNFYGAGKKTGMVFVGSDLSKRTTTLYSADEVVNIRVYDDHVYVLAILASPDENNPQTAVWRHPIMDNVGTLGPRELVLNWAGTGDYTLSTPTALTFAGDGTMFVASNNTSPLLMLSPAGDLDVMYKDILPVTLNSFEWGTGNFLYAIISGQEWTVVRIDIGKAGAPYWGREK
jgi:hypothetical protein